VNPNSWRAALRIFEHAFGTPGESGEQDELWTIDAGGRLLPLPLESRSRHVTSTDSLEEDVPDVTQKTGELPSRRGRWVRSQSCCAAGETVRAVAVMVEWG
jgi:hypothetical protein